jgi:hypothetical protein
MPQPIVAEVRDRSGALIPGREVFASVVSGGGQIVGPRPILTNAQGRAFIPVRLGPVDGVNSFRLAVAAGSVVLAQSVTVTAVPIARNRLGLAAEYGCSLRPAGSVACWGSNASGGLGTRATLYDSLPVPVGGGLTFETIAISPSEGSSNCGLTASGAAYCWGLNLRGTLGVASSETCAAFNVQVACAREPAVVSGGHAFVGISTNARTIATGNVPSRACAITRAGVAYCWGSNINGELGDNTTTERSAPTLVSTNARFRRIAAGRNATCGLTFQAQVYCWGAGPIGDGTSSRLVPTPISSADRFVDVDVGTNTACAVTEDGRSFCWGTDLQTFSTSSTIPRLVTGAPSFVSVRVGNQSVCGVTAASSVFCWGSQNGGALGNGKYSNAIVGTPTPVIGNLSLESVVPWSSAACAEGPTRDTWCWGFNTPLGNGARVATASPVRVNFARSAVSGPRALVSLVAPSTRWTAGALIPIPFNLGWEFAPPVLGVRVVDGNGNGVPGVPVQFRAVSGGGTVTTINQPAFTNPSGEQLREVRLGITPGPNVFRAVVPGVDSIDVRIDGVVPGTPIRLVCFDQFSNCLARAPAGGPASGVVRLVRAVDAEGLPDPDGVAGLLGFVADNVPRTDTVSMAMVTGVPASRRAMFLIIGADVAISVSPFSFIFSPRAGQPISSVGVALRDRFQNVANIAVPVTASIAAGPTGATLTGTTVVTSVNGIATFTNLRLSPSGVGYQLRFTSPGLTDGLSNVFIVVP